MAAYTYGPAPVLIETTGEFAIGATGVLRVAAGGEEVPITDLNDSPISSILVGPKGAHQGFKADIASGVLDFGSVLLPTVSIEALTAALAVQSQADALSGRVLALEQGSTSGFGRVRPLPRVPTSADADEGDLVLVNPAFAG